MATTLKNQFSTSEAAEFLGITASLVRRYVRAGKLPAEIIGEKVKLIPRAALEEFKKTPRKPGPKPG